MRTRKALSLQNVIWSLVGSVMLWAAVTDAWGYSKLLFGEAAGGWRVTLFNAVARLVWAAPAFVLLRRYAGDVPTGWRALFANRPRLKPFLIALVLNSLYILAGMFIIHGGFWVNPDADAPRMFVMFAVVAFVEELVYRGWGLNALSAFTRHANLLSSLFFVLLHVPAYLIRFALTGTIALEAMLTQCAMAFALGLVFGYLYGKGKSLWSPMIVHFLVDFLSVMLIG